jgi:glycosyltransferase involved in cell wall biosynthesis
MTTIAFYFPDFAGGGMEKMIIVLAGGLLARGYEVDLVVCRPNGPLRAEAPPRARIVDLGARDSKTSALALWRYLWDAKPDILISSLAHQNIVALIAKLCGPKQTKVFATQHNTLSVETAVSKNVRHRVVPLFYRWLLPHADGIFAVSEGVADDLAAAIGIPRERIRVLYNPVAPEDGSSELPGTMAERPFILGIGRLAEQKDFATLIDAFAEIAAQVPHDLVICGEGPLRSALEAQITSRRLDGRVHLVGYQSKPAGWMRAADLTVLSSRYEGFGLVLAESLAVGTPVVSTDCPSGPREILEGGKWGRLTPVGDARALGEAIVATLQAPPDAEALKKRACAFSVDRVVDRYVEALGNSGANLGNSGEKARLELHAKSPSRKVAFYLPSLRGGGAERTTLTVAGALAVRGYDVKLILDRPGGELEKALPPGTTRHVLSVARTSFAAPALARWIAKEKPDCVISSLLNNNLVAVAAAILSGSQTRTVLWEHQIYLDNAPLRERLASRLMATLYPRADCVVAVSQGVGENLRNRFQVESTVIYNPIDLDGVRANAGKEARHDWFENRSSPVVVSAGRLEAPKDFETLLHAVAQLDTRLIILGEGIDRPKIEKLARDLGIADRCFLPGFVLNPHAWMARADVFVLSSRSEGFGNVLVEALACGVPVISTNCPAGPREILDDGRYGRLVPPSDPGALAQAIQESLTDPLPGGCARAERFGLAAAVTAFENLIAA